jgi:DNA-directed RNA polymerase subunit M/transcription elongation factor TFIIS
MEVTLPDFNTLSCPSCGHKLQIPENIERFACAGCGKEHIVNRSGGVISLKPLTEETLNVQGDNNELQTYPMQPVEVNTSISIEPERPVEVAPPTPVSAAPTPTLAEARIICPKCKSENTPGTERCRDCDAKLLPVESVSQRLTYLITGIICAGVLGLLFYQFYIRNPGSAPDIVLCNPGALGLGAILAVILGFTQTVRKTPAYLKYENRAKRHVALNPSQALSDFNQAMELAPEKAQAGLLKQRADLYDKLGMTEDAARDHLALATSPDAYKEEGEWVSAFTGADADTHTRVRRMGQINSLLSSGSAWAVGYCPRCKNVVELDSNQHCRLHQKTKGQEIQYVIPADVLKGKLIVLQKLESKHSQLSTQLTELLNSGQAKAVGYCPRCKVAKELDSNRRCDIHPRVKGRKVQYVIPSEVEAAKKVVLRGRREETYLGQRRTFVVTVLVVMGIILLFIAFSTEITGFVQQLTE